MEERPKQPKIFANRVIKQLASHMIADGPKLKGEDYSAIRVAFRHLNGSWSELGAGDLKQLGLLQQVIMAWAAVPRPKKPNKVI